MKPRGSNIHSQTHANPCCNRHVLPGFGDRCLDILLHEPTHCVYANAESRDAQLKWRPLQHKHRHWFKECTPMQLRADCEAHIWSYFFTRAVAASNSLLWTDQRLAFSYVGSMPRDTNMHPYFERILVNHRDRNRSPFIGSMTDFHLKLACLYSLIVAQFFCDLAEVLQHLPCRFVLESY